MIDIYKIDTDVRVFNTNAPRARNILSVQIGAFEYEPDFGIDLEYFLSSDFKFQNESFKSYLIQVLSNYSINVAELIEVDETLFERYIFNLAPLNSGDGLIAR